MHCKIKQNTIVGIGLSLFFGLFFAHSDSVSAYSLTVTTSGSVTANVIPSADDGIGTTIATDNVNIISDCRAGYTMTVAGPSDNNLYLNGDSTNNTSGTYFTPVNGTSALNNSANANKWGYSLTANSESGVFSALSSTPTTLKTPSQTASPSSDIDTTIPVYYGTAVNNNMAPGSYTFGDNESITYSVTMSPTCLVYYIQYQGNGADNANGMGTTNEDTGEKSLKQTNVEEGVSVMLFPSNFKRAGYGFLGWSTDQEAYTHFTDNDTTNDPIIYGATEIITIDADIMASANFRNQINFYAVWVPALEDNNNPVYMQEWDNPNTAIPHDGCSTLTATIFDDSVADEKSKIIVNKNSVVALTDKRDNMVYAVTRLADGNCWMTENMRLEPEYTWGQNQNDPIVANRSLSQGYADGRGDGYGRFVGLADTQSTFSVSTSNVYKSDGSGDVFDSTLNRLEDLGVEDPSYRIPYFNNDNTSRPIDSTNYSQDCTSTATNFQNSNIYSYGNYYSWAAATANTVYYSSQVNTGSSYAGTSICPSGWALPNWNNYGELSKAYGGTGGRQQGASESGDLISNRFRAFPNNYLLSGNKGFMYNTRGTYGNYWTKNADGSISLATQLRMIGRESIYPTYSGNENRATGMTLRCVVIEQASVEITLDSNNGTDYIARLYGASGDSVNLPYTTFSKQGYYISGWNTAPDGSGTSYATSYTIPTGSTGVTLYAQWGPRYTITYVNNCKTYASVDSACTDSTSNTTDKQAIYLTNSPSTGVETGTLPAYNKWTLAGWKIKGWSTIADNSDNTNTEYGVGSTYTVTAGSNAGDSITLYAHWVPTYTIQYDGNGSDNDSTGMGSTNATTGIKTVAHTNVAEGDTFDLFASNFKKAGYGFVGWSTDNNAWTKLTDNNATNDAKIWGPNEVITAPAYKGTPITTLYAVWAPAETSGGNPVYLQNWTGCSAMTATTYNSSTGKLTVAKNSVTALTDQRDGNVYAIAKLADKNCWMVENLRLDNTAELSATNTNIKSSNSTLPITNVYGSTTSNYLSATSSSWCTSNSSACNNQSMINTTNAVANITPSQTQSITSANAHTNFNNTIYSYSNYYNWYSATAGYGTYSRSTSEPTAGDLCPAGWKLPYGNNGTSGTNIGNTKGGFYYLANQMNATNSDQASSNKLRMFPNNFIYSGYWNGSSATSRGAAGDYWSASASGSNAYYLHLLRNSVNPGSSSSNKYNGSSVRCVSAA